MIFPAIPGAGEDIAAEDDAQQVRREPLGTHHLHRTDGAPTSTASG